MQKIIILTFFLTLAFAMSSQLQFTPKNLLSPNAASLGEYGAIPVSPYTGLQNVSIPLHEIKVGEHTIPITLSYHAGGVRVEQLPGWVGLGWTLNAGGCISRVVNSEVDEFCNVLNGDTILKSGYFYKHANFHIGSASDSTSLYRQLKNIAGVTDIWDVAPDKFCFNFLGYNGVFYMDHNGAWKVLCNKPLQVVFEGNDDDFTRTYSETSNAFSLEGTNASTVGRSHHFKTFTLIGEDGTKYIFGGDDSAIEYSINLFNQRKDHLRATTWHLTKITYPNSREIRFSYEHGSYIAQLFLNDFCKSIKIDSGDYECGFGGLTPPYIYSGSLIMPSYLMNISYDYGHLYFEKSDSHDLQYKQLEIICNRYADASGLTDRSVFMPILANNGAYTSEYRDYPSCLAALKRKKLDKIHIYTTDTAYKTIPTKYIKLEYTDTATQRLTLKNICVGFNSGNGNEASFQFEYNHPELIPDYTSNKTDHWGFANVVESPRVFSNNYETTREPSSIASEYGILTKITYPTGGYNRFVYEPHDYMKVVTEERTGVVSLSSKKLAGGVRIKQIINSPTGNQADEYIDKEYFYVSDYLDNGKNASQSSGILTQLYKYSYPNKELPASNYDGATVFIEAFGSQSFIPAIGNISSNHIEYSEVVERNNDGSFVILNYTNFGDGHVDNPTIATLFNQSTIYEPKCSKDQERGLLKQKTEYNAAGTKQKETIYDYEKSGTEMSNHVEIFRTNVETICGYACYEGSAYYAYTYTMRPKKQVETIYQGSDSIRKETGYTYNSIGLVSSITKKQSDDTKIKTSYKYPNDFLYMENTKYDEMRNMFRHSPIVEICIEEIDENNISTPIKKTFYLYDKNTLKPSSVDVAYGAGDYLTQVTYEHDNYGNIINECPIDGPEICHIWGYYGTKLLATTYNTPYPFIVAILNTFNKYSSQRSPDLSKLSFIRKHSQCGGIITYSYNSMGLLDVATNVTGNKTYYYYDILGRLVAVKDEDGNYIEVYNYNYAH